MKWQSNVDIVALAGSAVVIIQEECYLLSVSDSSAVNAY